MAEPVIVNAYVESKNIVLLRREGNDLSVVKQPAEYVSYHKVADLTPEKLRLLRRDDGLRGDRMEGEWYRVQWHDFLSRKMALQDNGILARLALPHYEADVHPIRRYLVDSGARVQKPRRAFLDIETDSRLSFARLRAGQGRVLCWTVVDEAGRANSGCLKSDFDGAERELLLELLDVLDGFDQIVAWNGDGFDFPVLKGDTRMDSRSQGRFRHLGIRVNTRRWLWIDHLALYKRMNLQTARSGDEKQSYRLQDIATAVLYDGKEAFDSSKTWEAWLCTDASAKFNRDALVRYNVKDTDLLRRIEEKTGFLALLDTICDCCGTLPDTRGMRPLNQLDPFMLRLGLARGMHFPTVTRFESDDDKKKFAGAYVMEPKFPPGILRDVHVCDFKSLYPSIIISWNMSPETKVEGSRGSMGSIPANCSRAPGTGVMFRTDVQGLLPLAVDRLLTMRSEWKKKKGSCVPGTPEWMDADRRSNAYKVTSNAFFGGTGNEFSRFNDVDVAESITQAGVYLDHAVEDALVSGGWFCGYGDTDSTMVSGDRDRRVFSAAVKTVLNEQVIPRVMEEHGCVDRRVSIAYEKQFNRIVFLGKKRYVGTYLHYEGSDALLDSEPEIKGLEFKRGDTNKIARRLQERIIRMLFGDWEPTCASCGGKCKRGAEAPKGRLTANFWSCPMCGQREDGGLRFAPSMDDPGDYSAIIAKARDHVLLAKLPREFVTVSKSIQQPLEDYVVKTKLDGTPAAQPPHVQVAKMLAERGEEVSVGTKIAYVVVDGSDDKPTRAIPASDYVGDCDRFYLWDNLIWPPIERVLDAALPGTPWRRMFGRTRPAKEKPPKRGGAAPGQLGFFGNHVPASNELASSLPPLPLRVEGVASVPAMRSSTVPYPIHIPVEKATHELLQAVRAACLRYPGTRPVQVEILGVGPHYFTVEMLSGDLRVAGAHGLMAELRSLLDRLADGFPCA